MSNQPGATSAKDQETLGTDAQIFLITQGEPTGKGVSTVGETVADSSTDIKEKELRELRLEAHHRATGS